MSSNHVHFRAFAIMIVALLLGSVSRAEEASRLPAGSDGDSIDVDPNVFVIDDTTVAAWRRLLAADTEIAALIERGELAGISEQSVIIKVAATTIGETVQVGDPVIRKRLDSGIRKIVGLADHLREVAASGKMPRVGTVYRNLRKYIEWARDNLPSLPAEESSDLPVTEQAPPPGSL